MKKLILVILMLVSLISLVGCGGAQYKNNLSENPNNTEYEKLILDVKDKADKEFKAYIESLEEYKDILKLKDKILFGQYALNLETSEVHYDMMIVYKENSYWQTTRMFNRYLIRDEEGNLQPDLTGKHTEDRYYNFEVPFIYFEGKEMKYIYADITDVTYSRSELVERLTPRCQLYYSLGSITLDCIVEGLI